MLFTLHVLNSLTTDDYQLARDMESLWCMRPNPEWRPQSEKPPNVINTIEEKIVTFTSDNNKQITIDLRLTKLECLYKMLDMVDQVKTENSKLFYDEGEISKQVDYYT